MGRKTIVLITLGVWVVLLLMSPAIKKVTGQESGNVVLSLTLDPYTAINNAEDNQPFAVHVNANVPQGQPVAGLDATVTYDKNKLRAVKVLPGNQTDFANGYFGVTSKVDTDQSCKDQKTDQAKRLECAINQAEGIVAVTALNLDASQYLNTDPPQWPPPANPQITGDFILATVIFQPQAVGPSGNIALDITNNNSNAYSWVDLAPTPGQDSQQVLSSQTPDPRSTNILNQTNCEADFVRDTKIDFRDVDVLVGDIEKPSCSTEYCRADIRPQPNPDGKIDFRDVDVLVGDIDRRNCQP